ncbi:PREDICTED: uncharacterized protein LOC106909131 [Poecilia mexicana]|uniref:uncharacterized protein LOC106909131 n=1 Tax=Poecilia mexicana TaxID=48701 RepID=UPI00072E50F2|nr:PREDICTED: uncharacterized protein LOC106909131 [Poecilia mexicana]XP_016523069.1 PREDICTED: uncharacterized protein LOC107835248 [Poecilia formosa]
MAQLVRIWGRLVWGSLVSPPGGILGPSGGRGPGAAHLLPLTTVWRGLSGRSHRHSSARVLACDGNIIVAHLRPPVLRVTSLCAAFPRLSIREALSFFKLLRTWAEYQRSSRPRGVHLLVATSLRPALSSVGGRSPVKRIPSGTVSEISLHSPVRPLEKLTPSFQPAAPDPSGSPLRAQTSSPEKTQNHADEHQFRTSLYIPVGTVFNKPP